MFHGNDPGRISDHESDL